MPPTARDIARHVLRRVRRDQAYASLVLSSELARQRRLGQADRSLATDLVYGVLRQRRLLDHVLAQHSSRPLRRVDPDVLDALRLAAYQMLLLDRVPAHAAVNDAVEVVRTTRGKGVAGFTNAVLRKLTPADLERDLPADPVSRLAVSCSLPDWLARAWCDQLGLEQATALARSLLQRAPLAARVNSLKATPDALRADLEALGASVEPGRHAPDALTLARLGRPFTSASYLDGRWTAQDEAAQLASHLLDPQPGETVVDACSGVGGKATHLAALMQNRGQVICVDHSQRKLQLLGEHCLRLGASCCEPRQLDLLADGALDGLGADRLLLDAPCSGLGVLRRHPEQKWRLEPRQLQELAQLQRRLLSTAVRALRPGGVLVYSVCTTTDAEGPDQVAWLEATHPLRLQPPTAGPLARLASDGTARLWPHSHGTDGFFLARLERTAVQ